MTNPHSVFIYIDVFTMCNLRCPACVIGDRNRPENRPTAKKMMTVETLSRILDKALKEVSSIEGVGFFNWTEPLLHPEIAELVREVTRRGIRCWVSTNLNVLRDPGRLLAARPHEIIVSVSGFTQGVYERGHKGGDIETVKQNMRLLADTCNSYATQVPGGGRTWLRLVYHRYADNAADEDAMAVYAKKLGYTFSPVWAYITSVERVLAIHANSDIFEDDQTLMDRLALPFLEAMQIVSATPARSCAHLDGRLTIDANGDTYLCCASSGATTNLVGNFLEMPLTAIQANKAVHSLCDPCMQNAVMNYFSQAESGDGQLNAIAVARRAAFSDRP